MSTELDKRIAPFVWGEGKAADINIAAIAALLAEEVTKEKIDEVNKQVALLEWQIERDWKGTVLVAALRKGLQTRLKQLTADQTRQKETS